MVNLIRRWHIYAGLMTFWALLVFGAAGTYVTFRPDKRLEPEPKVERVAFKPKKGATDREVADLMRDEFGFGNTKPVPDWVIRRNEQGRLTLPLWSPNGWVNVTWLEDEGVAELTRDPFSTGEYVNQMHSAVPLANGAPLKLLWSIYTELSIFTLMFLVASGIYLWVATRRYMWWTFAAFGAGTAVFVFFFFWVS